MEHTTEPLEDWERALLEGTPDTRPTAKVDAAHREAEARAGDGWEVAMAHTARETALMYTNPDALAHMVRRPRWDYPTDTMSGYCIQVRDNVRAVAERLGLSLYRP